MPDATLPRPVGWNRFQLEVADIASTIEKLRAGGARFRNDVITGAGGNPVELFEPSLDEARLSARG